MKAMAHHSAAARLLSRARSLRSLKTLGRQEEKYPILLELCDLGAFARDNLSNSRTRR